MRVIKQYVVKNSNTLSRRDTRDLIKDKADLKERFRGQRPRLCMCTQTKFNDKSGGNTNIHVVCPAYPTLNVHAYT